MTRASEENPAAQGWERGYVAKPPFTWKPTEQPVNWAIIQAGVGAMEKEDIIVFWPFGDHHNWLLFIL